MTTTEQTWFDITARENFIRHLLSGGHALQLGCFAGDATMWLVDHHYTVADVDTFKGSDEHAGIDMTEVRRVYEFRTAGFRPGRIRLYRQSTEDFLRDQEPGVNEYDFIYIDADHRAAAVLSDAVMSWPLLVTGGLMAFDDYTWGPQLESSERPANGIAAFIIAYGDQFDIIERNAQLWVRKR